MIELDLDPFQRSRIDFAVEFRSVNQRLECFDFGPETTCQVQPMESFIRLAREQKLDSAFVGWLKMRHRFFERSWSGSVGLGERIQGNLWSVPDTRKRQRGASASDPASTFREKVLSCWLFGPGEQTP